jgi:hypothetical protein
MKNVLESGVTGKVTRWDDLFRRFIVKQGMLQTLDSMFDKYELRLNRHHNKAFLCNCSFLSKTDTEMAHD